MDTLHLGAGMIAPMTHRYFVFSKPTDPSVAST